MISAATLETLTGAVLASGLADAGVAAIRARLPELHLVFCLDDEMGMAEPYRECAGFNLYLIHAGDHCMGLTGDPGSAFGVVVAEVET